MKINKLIKSLGKNRGLFFGSRLNRSDWWFISRVFIFQLMNENRTGLKAGSRFFQLTQSVQSDFYNFGFVCFTIEILMGFMWIKINDFDSFGRLAFFMLPYVWLSFPLPCSKMTMFFFFNGKFEVLEVNESLIWADLTRIAWE